jgi:hypothetical protein
MMAGRGETRRGAGADALEQRRPVERAIAGRDLPSAGGEAGEEGGYVREGGSGPILTDLGLLRLVHERNKLAAAK